MHLFVVTACICLDVSVAGACRATCGQGRGMYFDPVLRRFGWPILCCVFQRFRPPAAVVLAKATRSRPPGHC